jgi:type I restriction enzyme S subunit
MSVVSLGELVSVQTGKLDANASSPDGAYPFFTCAREPLRIADWKYDLDAILVAGNGDLNVKHYKGKFDAYQRTYILSSKDENRVDTRYLYHFMDTYLETLRAQSIGGIIKYIKLGMLTDAPIPLPPLDGQKRIAAILDQADELRRKRQCAIDRLNQLGQAIFNEMFGEWDRKGANTDVIQLGDHLDFLTSGSRGWAEYYRESGGLFLRIQNVKRDELDLSDVAYVDAPNSAEAKRTRVEPGDVLLSITADLGRTAVIPEDIGEAYINQHLAIIRSRAFKPRFLSAALASPSGQRGILKRNREGVKAGLNFDDVRSVMIPKVSMDMQDAFSRRLDFADRLRNAQKNALKVASDLFASLQHRAFQGEL